MVGIVVQDFLQDFRVHQSPIEESRGHGMSGEEKWCKFCYLLDDQGLSHDGW
jgi:hypothetical protein